MRVGEHDLTNSGPDCSDDVCNLGVQDMDVEKITVHESYNKPFSFQNDIALVKLKRKVSENGKSNYHFRYQTSLHFGWVFKHNNH